MYSAVSVSEVENILGEGGRRRELGGGGRRRGWGRIREMSGKWHYVLVTACSVEVRSEEWKVKSGK